MKDIHLNKLIGEVPTVSYSIGQLDKLINQQLTESLQVLGVSLPQFTMLSILYLNGEMANSKLASRSLISPQASNQIIKTMAEKGWVSKSDDPNHGRIILIGLTDQGKNIYWQCRNKAIGFEQRILNGIPPENILMLKATIQRIIMNSKELSQ